uniref:Uncharacterized protein n=1 Tax=Plectus sambesii TaxID=2011161 RepID=A0A914W948_9BILA
MFTSWNNEGKLTEGSIRQANEHLLLVNQRVIELEQRILEQKELLDRREQEHVERLRALACKKDAEIKLLQQELTTARQQTARSEGIIKERDVQIAFLLHRLLS